MADAGETVVVIETVPQSEKILVLGAGGLIGNFVATDFQRRRYPVAAVARKFSASQRYVLGDSAIVRSVSDCDAGQLAKLLTETSADVVVNCLGMLQAMPGEGDIHDEFVAKLIEAIRLSKRDLLLVHISIPGIEADDHTNFALTKRNADRRIQNSGLSYAILRPGFVLAPAAYGGSALLRALAAFPFVDLPKRERNAPFASIAIEDVAATAAWLAAQWSAGERKQAVVWDLMHPAKVTVGDVVDALRRWSGADGSPRFAPPAWLLDVGARFGDLAAFLGWRPPVRSTAMAEMRRGVVGDPAAWMAATGIVPRALDKILEGRPHTVQEKWFGRLFLVKAFNIVVLTIFWCVSGGIVLAFSFKPAVAILTAHGFSSALAVFSTIFSSLMDISVGLAIAFRRTHRAGLVAGIFVSLFYMMGAAILTPELWIEPLGALVKTGPAIALMLVALATADDR